MPDPIQMNPNNSGTLKIGPTGTLADYGCQITDMQITPAQNLTQRPGTYCAAPTQVPGRSTWSMRFGFLQDWTDPSGLAQFTLDNDGTLQDFEFLPDVTGAPTVSGKVWITATPYGGLPAEAWVSSGTWPIDGTPTVTPPVTVAAGRDTDVDLETV